MPALFTDGCEISILFSTENNSLLRRGYGTKKATRKAAPFKIFKMIIDGFNVEHQHRLKHNFFPVKF